MEIKQWLESLVKGLVADPASVVIIEKKDDMGVLYTIRLNNENGDAGKIIGRQGKTIQAIRAITFAKGFMHDVRASVKVDVPYRTY